MHWNLVEITIRLSYLVTYYWLTIIKQDSTKPLSSLLLQCTSTPLYELFQSPSLPAACLNTQVLRSCHFSRSQTGEMRYSTHLPALETPRVSDIEGATYFEHTCCLLWTLHLLAKYPLTRLFYALLLHFCTTRVHRRSNFQSLPPGHWLYCRSFWIEDPVGKDWRQ